MAKNDIFPKQDVLGYFHDACAYVIPLEIIINVTWCDIVAYRRPEAPFTNIV